MTREQSSEMRKLLREHILNFAYGITRCSCGRWQTTEIADSGHREWVEHVAPLLTSNPSDVRKALEDGIALVESAYAHVSHGGPTREDADRWLKLARTALADTHRGLCTVCDTNHRDPQDHPFSHTALTGNPSPGEYDQCHSNSKFCDKCGVCHIDPIKENCPAAEPSPTDDPERLVNDNGEEVYLPIVTLPSPTGAAAEVKASLLDYAEHQPPCRGNVIGEPCICGLRALAAQKEASTGIYDTSKWTHEDHCLFQDGNKMACTCEPSQKEAPDAVWDAAVEACARIVLRNAHSSESVQQIRALKGDRPASQTEEAK